MVKIFLLILCFVRILFPDIDLINNELYSKNMLNVLTVVINYKNKVESKTNVQLKCKRKCNSLYAILNDFLPSLSVLIQ